MYHATELKTVYCLKLCVKNDYLIVGCLNTQNTRHSCGRAVPCVCGVVMSFYVLQLCVGRYE